MDRAYLLTLANGNSAGFEPTSETKEGEAFPSSLLHELFKVAAHWAKDCVGDDQPPFAGLPSIGVEGPLVKLYDNRQSGGNGGIAVCWMGNSVYGKPKPIALKNEMLFLWDGMISVDLMEVWLEVWKKNGITFGKEFDGTPAPYPTWLGV